MGDQPQERRLLLFWACFIALIATAFGFIIRAMIMDEWAAEFGLTETQKGEIFGVGLWPFAISIVLFSLIIDYVGYGKAMIFAFGCHLISGIVTISTTYVYASSLESGDQESAQAAAYWMLYLGNFIVALGNGTVEAVINPVVATMFPKEKAKWLNILHAGWPGGLVLGGVLTIFMSSTESGFGGLFPESLHWSYKVGLLFIPVIVYGLMMIPCKFPVHERVAAGVSYKEMLAQVGAAGALIILGLAISEVGRVFEWGQVLRYGVIIGLTLGYGAYTQALGRPMFIFLLLIMIPLATTELGTDSWITSLMESPMKEANFHPGWVLVYTSFIMFALRYWGSDIVHLLSPLGLLAAASVVAAIGLYLLGTVSGFAMIFVAATVYGFGKTFFWPTMLGVVAEQYPRGGALTLNVIGGVGMLSVGVVGAQFLGSHLDGEITQRVQQIDKKQETSYFDTYFTEEKKGLFGEYKAVDEKKLAKYDQAQEIKAQVKEDTGKEDEALEQALEQNEEYQAIVSTDEYQQQAKFKENLDEVSTESRRATLRFATMFPGIMFVCYMILIFYFMSKGGYKAEVLTGHEAEDKEFTGGVEGPVEA